MPTLARGTGTNTPSLAVTLNDPGPHQVHGRAAAGGLTNGDLVYLASVGGVPTLTLASGAAANAAALAVGVVLRTTPAGEKAVAYHGVEVKYGTGLVPGTRVYASATAGALDDAATTGGTAPVGVVVNDTNIFVLTPTR